MNGKIKFFNDAKRFGFISGEDGTDYFVHASAVEGGVALKEGDAVTFEVVEGDKGPKAGSVKKA